MRRAWPLLLGAWLLYASACFVVTLGPKWALLGVLMAAITGVIFKEGWGRL